MRPRPATGQISQGSRAWIPVRPLGEKERKRRQGMIQERLDHNARQIRGNECATPGVGIRAVVSRKGDRHTMGGTKATNDTTRVISAKAQKAYSALIALTIGVQL